MSIESPFATLSTPLRRAALPPRQNVEDVVASVRKATWSRTGFAIFVALVSLTVLPAWIALTWAATMALWETALRIWLENTFVLPAARRDEDAGSRRLAAVHFVGSFAYSLYPVLCWATGEPLGMVIATAWVCSSANHLFVYFSANRTLLIACITPLAVMSIIAPLTSAGLDLFSMVSIATLMCMIVAAGLFGLDRHVLLSNMAKLAAARAAAEQANAAKSQFLTTMSHELRTPLNAVIGYAELIEEEAEQGVIAEDAGKIRTSARQLLGVIDVILDLSKLETGAVSLQRERGPVSSVLEQLRAAALPLAATNNNTLTVTELSPLGDAEIDHMRLHQCLMQLISNAAKFTKDGAITVTAARAGASEGERLEFVVTDTGIGISADQQAGIFDAFVQVESDAARKYEGAGLGLTLVRRLARLMGGDVACVSTPGEGAVFRLWVAA